MVLNGTFFRRCFLFHGDGNVSIGYVGLLESVHLKV